MAAPPSPPAGRLRRRRLSSVLLPIALLLAAFLVIAGHVTLNEYVLEPGQAQAVAPLIKVPPSRAHPVHGSVLLTDVLVAPVTLLDWIPDHLSGNNQIVPTVELTGGSNIPASELDAQGYLEMAQAKEAAKTAAFRHLGYTVPENDAGAVVEAVSTGAPGYGKLSVGQVITAVDGQPTTTVCGFVTQLATLKAGQTAALTVQANRFSPSGLPISGPTVTKSVKLAPRPSGLPAVTGCPNSPHANGFIGVSVGTQQNFTYPFAVSISTPDIGGPSAGLAMTLGLIDTLAGGHLTGGHTVAATGTIDPLGNVGDVGGVAQKTIAVERAGATVFFVPTPELAAARSKATSSLRVFAVNTLGQVLSDLEKLGGRVQTAAKTA
jgi:PDZ domain-containing protein